MIDSLLMKLYDISTEQALIGSILIEGKLFEEIIGILDETDFYKESHQIIFSTISKLFKENKGIDLVILTEELNKTNLLEKIGGVTYLTNLINSVPTTANLHHYVKITKDYSYKRTVLSKINKFKTENIDAQKLVEDIVNIPKYEEIKEKTNKDIILETMDDAQRGMDFRFGETFEDINNIIGGVDKGDLIIVGGYASNGKCFGKNTKVVMYSGKLKKVQNVKVGDLLMGIDSTPRKVLSLHSGIDKMYIVKQYKGLNYIANGNHILTLRKSDYARKTKKYLRKNGNFQRPNGLYSSYDNITNISIDEFIQKSNPFKKNFLGYRTGVEFPSKKVKIAPYFLGIFLGDGSSSKTAITTADKEISDYLYQHAVKLDLRLSVSGKKDSKAKTYRFAKKNTKANIEICSKKIYKNKKWLENIYLKKELSSLKIGKLCKVNYVTILNWLKKYNIKRRPSAEKNELEKRFIKYNLIDNKHIPDDYLYNTRKIRLRVLAGLIDTDGYTNGNGYEIIQKNKILSYQIYYLASSLGFRCSINKRECSIKSIGFKGIYYRISINGEVYNIPIKIERKKIKPYKQKRNPYTTGLKIKYKGVGKYYGFTLDGDGLFLLEDFTVLHNSSLAINFAIDFCQEEKNVLYCTFEMSPKAIMRRILAHNNWINTMHFRKKGGLTEEDKDKIKTNIDIIDGVWNYNCVKVYTITDIKRAINHHKPDICFIDYLQNISGDDNLSFYAKRTKHVMEIQRLAREQNITIFLLSQFNRPQDGKIGRPHNNSLRDSGAIEERADIIFLIYWERKLRQENLYRQDGDDPEYIEISITKSKDGLTGGLGYNFYPEYHQFLSPDKDDKEPIIYKKAKEVSGEYYKRNV